MKKVFLKVGSILLVFALLACGQVGFIKASAATVANAIATETVGNATARVDAVEIGGRTCYIYVPASERVGNMIGLAPLIVVFGEGKYTEADVLKEVRDSGFGDIATRDGLCILFANPIMSWDSAADASAAGSLIAGIFDTFSCNPTYKFVNGVAKVTDEKTGETKTYYPAFELNLQMFGEGKGADYIMKNFTVPNAVNANYATQVFPGTGMPGAVALFNPSKLTVKSETGGAMNIAIVGGPANSLEVAASYATGGKNIYKVIDEPSVTGFTKDLVISLYDEVLDKNASNYAQNGIIEVCEYLTLSTGKTMKYFKYIPDTLDLTAKGKIPLMIWNHGGGGDAETQVEMTKWPEYAKEFGIVVLAIDQHQGFTGDEIVEMVDAELAKNAFLDGTRVYIGGFSMGAATTWNAGLQCWNRFAGMAPNAGIMVAQSEILDAAVKAGGILPTFYICGGVSPLPELPSEQFQAPMQYLFKLNAIGEYTYDADAGAWGAKPDSTYSVSYIFPDDGSAQELVVNGFESSDGNTYTLLGINKNRAHTVTSTDVPVVWNFLKQFRRNADGTISIVKEVKAETKVKDAATAHMKGNSTERVDKVSVGGRDCFVYVPASERVGNFLGGTPLLVVFADEALKTSADVLAFAKQAGIADIATRDGLCVFFANPVKAWDDPDEGTHAAELIAGIYELFSCVPSYDFVNGVAKVTDEETGETKTYYPAFELNLQMIGEGKGADYLMKNFTVPNEVSANYATQIFPGTGMPGAVALFDPSTLAVKGETGGPMSIAIVGGPENSLEVAASYAQGTGRYLVIDSESDGIDAELLQIVYDNVVDAAGDNYAQKGIVEVYERRTLSNGKTIEYYKYIPDNLDLTVKGSIPLFIWCHGFGGDAETQVAMAGLPTFAREKGIIALSVDQHPSFTADELIEILDMELNDYPYYDATRVYAGGFSMGSDKTWNLGLTYWNRFAGIFPNALGMFADSEAVAAACEAGGPLPTFYIAGGLSVMELGSSNFTQTAMKNLWVMNNLPGTYEYNAELGEWGMKPDSIRSISYLLNDGTAQQLVIDSFKSTDGNTYTWFAVNKNRAHIVTPNDLPVVWAELSRFSRSPSGALIVDGVGPWYQEAADAAVEKDLMEVSLYGGFRPNDNITRAELAKALYRLSGNAAYNVDDPFADITGANEALTREQVAVILYEFATDNAYSLAAGSGAALSSYTDAAAVTDAAKSAMEWACDVGLFNGYPDGSIRSQATVNRAVAATLLNRFINLSK